MQNISVSNSRKIIESNNVKYTLDEVCPFCGRYTPNGEICIICQKEHNMYKPKITYIDGVQ
jgi:rRNA maturation protein Nop10